MNLLYSIGMKILACVSYHTVLLARVLFVLIQKYRANQVLLRNGLELYVQIGVFGVPFYKGPTGWHFIPH